MNTQPEILVTIWLLPGFFCFCVALTMHSIPVVRKIYTKLLGRVRKKQRGNYNKEPQNPIQQDELLRNSISNA